VTPTTKRSAGREPGAFVETIEQASVKSTANDEPEHRGDRRRFLIWACMAGFVKPERVTERIVAEVAAGTP
jgi:hypothetical protein